MVDFRKWFPALALIALLLGSVVTANAQAVMTCQQQGTPATVRSEGVTELLGDIILTCTGGNPTTGGTSVQGVNLNVFLSTNITSRIVSGSDLTEALLLVDEPVEAAMNPCILGTGPIAITCPITGTGVGANISTNSPGGVDYSAAGVFNVFQGRLVTQPGTGLQYLSWAGVPIDPPGSAGFRTIRITNVRGNASAVGAGIPGFPGNITALITTSGAINVPSPSVIVGAALRGLGGVETRPGYGNASPFFLCEGNEVDEDGPSFRVRLTEGFLNAFKPRTIAGNPLQVGSGSIDGESVDFVVGQAPGSTPAYTGLPLAPVPQTTLFGTGGVAIWATESGVYNPAFTSTNGLNVAGLADTGTRFRVRMTGLPTTGVTIYAGTAEDAAYNAQLTNGENPTFGYSRATSRVVLISGANAAGAGGSASTGSTVNDVPGLTTVTVGSDGSATLIYEVVGSDPTRLENIDIPFFVSFAANTPTVLSTAPSASVSLAPISSINRAATAAEAPIPRFIEQALTDTTFVINPCRTNLLFPWVTNQFGFDTGIAITNTSRDVFGTTNESGPCTMNYFGCTLAAGQCTGAAPGLQRSAAVPAGGSLAFTLQFGAGADHPLIIGGQAFRGYIIAECDFRYAHGFAFILGPGGQVAEGYLALVMDTPIGSRTTFISEALDN